MQNHEIVVPGRLAFQLGLEDVQFVSSSEVSGKIVI
jgi:hypothetical protein